MAEGLTSEGIERLHLVVIVLTQRMFETSQAPQVHRDIQAAAHAAHAAHA
jgi:hypothetical protein